MIYTLFFCGLRLIWYMEYWFIIHTRSHWIVRWEHYWDGEGIDLPIDSIWATICTTNNWIYSAVKYWWIVEGSICTLSIYREVEVVIEWWRWEEHRLLCLLYCFLKWNKEIERLREREGEGCIPWLPSWGTSSLPSWQPSAWVQKASSPLNMIECVW